MPKGTIDTWRAQPGVVLRGLDQGQSRKLDRGWNGALFTEDPTLRQGLRGWRLKHTPRTALGSLEEVISHIK